MNIFTEPPLPPRLFSLVFSTHAASSSSRCIPRTDAKNVDMGLILSPPPPTPWRAIRVLRQTLSHLHQIPWRAIRALLPNSSHPLPTPWPTSRAPLPTFGLHRQTPWPALPFQARAAPRRHRHRLFAATINHRLLAGPPRRRLGRRGRILHHLLTTRMLQSGASRGGSGRRGRRTSV